MIRNRALKQSVLGVAALLGVTLAALFLLYFFEALEGPAAGLAVAICVAFALGAGFAAVFPILREYRAIRALRQIISVLERGGQAETLYAEGDVGALYTAVLSLHERARYSMDAVGRERRHMQTLLYDISHQLKTPLSALMMYTELMRTREMDYARREEILALCDGQLDRVNSLVQGLLKLARMEYGAVEMQLKDTPFSATLERAMSSLWPVLRAQGIDLSVEAPQDLSFRHDCQWVAEALSNIVKNAAEHTPAGGGVTICAEETPLSVEVSIRDTGAGIAPEDMPHIFERFYRTQNARADHVGIGLSLAKRIIEENNGDIYVKSEPGRGSEFIITFIK